MNYHYHLYIFVYYHLLLAMLFLFVFVGSAVGICNIVGVSVIINGVGDNDVSGVIGSDVIGPDGDCVVIVIYHNNLLFKNTSNANELFAHNASTAADFLMIILYT